MKYTTNNSIKTFRNFVGLLLCFSAITPVWATGVSSWTDLATTDDVVFASDITAEGTPQIIQIKSDNISFDGNGHALTGAAGYQIKFSKNTTTGGTTTIKNIASVTGFTGIPFIFSSQTLLIDNTRFESNNGKLMSISLDGANGTLANSVFYNNTFTTSDSGLINVSQCNLTIDHGTFGSNKSLGSIIDFLSSAKITNSIFQNNTTTYYGAIQLSGGVIEISDSEFTNNTGSYDGGAISDTHAIKSITNTTFKQNTAKYGDGGAIWEPLQSSQEEIFPLFYKVTFEENSAPQGMGGGMYLSGAGEPSNTSWILKSVFKGNSANFGGGLLTSNLVDLFIVDTDFSENTAKEGGAIYAADMKLNIYADTQDVVFKDNTASNTTEDYNGGAAIYFENSGDNENTELNLNAADGKKIVFDNTVAAYGTPTLNINKSGLSYELPDHTSKTIANSGEIQFNDRVGDADNFFNINLYGGKLSIGQNATNNASIANPDGYINDNNFYVKGASTLNTINGIIGEFAPNTFQIDAKMSYEFDIDLVNKKADMLKGAANNASVELSVLNIISDSDESNLKIVYSDKNVNGALKDGYSITTSSATYDITAENHDSGSYLMFAKDPTAMTGLPGAILNGSDVYSNTSGTDEVVEKWGENDLSADLVVNGNNHGFTTENNLDGINVDSNRTLTMNNVTDMSGFNYAVKNEGKVALHNTVISDDIINNGTLSINDGSSVGAISGTGTMNVNSDLTLNGNISGNTVNINNAKLSNLDKLGSDTTLNAVGGTIDLNNKQATVKSAIFDENSTLALTVNSLSDHGSLTADTISVANGAQLKATLGQGILGNEKTATIQLLSANNTDFNNFTDSFDNKMYHFEKADKNGAYTISQTNSAEDVVRKNGGQRWVGKAAKAYVDGPKFKEGTMGADVADKLAALAQNDVDALIGNIKALAPTETAVVQGQAIEDVNRLFKTVDGYLRGQRDPFGMSAGDVLEGASIWAKPYVGQTKLSKRGKVSGFDTDSRGIILGLEKKLNPEIKIGGGIQYDETEIDGTKRDIDTDTLIGYMYGEYKPNRWFANAVLSYGKSGYHEHKYALGKKFNAKYDVDAASITAMTGYQLKYVTPEIGMRYYNIHRNGYKDSADQHVQSADTNIVRMVAGVHYVTQYDIFYPNVHAGVTYDLVQGKHNTIVNLANGTTYRVDGKRISRVGYELNVGVDAHVTDDITLGINYMGTYRDKYQEHTGILMFKYDL